MGVMVALESAGKADELAALGKQLAMHIAATNPQALDVAGLDPAVVKREKEVLADNIVSRASLRTSSRRSSNRA